MSTFGAITGRVPKNFFNLTEATYRAIFNTLRDTMTFIAQYGDDRTNPSERRTWASEYISAILHLQDALETAHRQSRRTGAPEDAESALISFNYHYEMALSRMRTYYERMALPSAIQTVATLTEAHSTNALDAETLLVTAGNLVSSPAEHNAFLVLGALQRTIADRLRAMTSAPARVEKNLLPPNVEKITRDIESYVAAFAGEDNHAGRLAAAGALISYIGTVQSRGFIAAEAKLYEAISGMERHYGKMRIQQAVRAREENLPRLRMLLDSNQKQREVFDALADYVIHGPASGNRAAETAWESRTLITTIRQEAAPTTKFPGTGFPRPSVLGRFLPNDGGRSLLAGMKASERKELDAANRADNNNDEQVRRKHTARTNMYFGLVKVVERAMDNGRPAESYFSAWGDALDELIGVRRIMQAYLDTQGDVDRHTKKVTHTVRAILAAIPDFPVHDLVLLVENAMDYTNREIERHLPDWTDRYGVSALLRDGSGRAPSLPKAVAPSTPETKTKAKAMRNRVAREREERERLEEQRRAEAARRAEEQREQDRQMGRKRLVTEELETYRGGGVDEARFVTLNDELKRRKGDESDETRAMRAEYASLYYKILLAPTSDRSGGG